jgi:predicted ATPase
MKRYVITGGPSSGKSSIILELELRGEYVTREAAEDYIRLMKAKGQPEPWLAEDFQQKILALSVQREARISPDVARVFHDRSRIDGLAYEPASWIMENINSEIAKIKYDLVFLVQMQAEVASATYRRENEDEAALLEQALIMHYSKQGYPIITVERGTVDERVDFILEKIK